MPPGHIPADTLSYDTSKIIMYVYEKHPNLLQLTEDTIYLVLCIVQISHILIF